MAPGVGEIDTAVGFDDDVIGPVQLATLKAVGDDGDPAVMLLPGDPPRVMLAGNKPPLRIAGPLMRAALCHFPINR